MSFGRKHDYGDYGSFLNDISSWVDDDCAELAWENGQLMVKTQASSASRAPVATSSHFATSGAHADTVEGNTAFSQTGKLVIDEPYLAISGDAVEEQKHFSKAGKLVIDEPFLHDKSQLFPSAEVDLCPNDELVPWLGYPFGDYTAQQCSPDFLLPEVSRDMGNRFSTHNGSVPVVEKRTDLHCCNASSKALILPDKTNVLWPPQDTRIAGAAGSGVSDFMSVESGKKEIPVATSKLVNFPHFTRQTTNLPNSTEVPNSLSSSKGKAPSRGSFVVDDSSEKCISPALNGKFPSSVDLVKDIPDDGRSLEAHIAGSSTGIAPGADLASCNQTNDRNMKFDDNEDSESHSSDSISECSGSKRSTPQKKSGSKRKRTAEVHNSSEKRRRNRINEKMKELQELIPNSIKTDKASMLDQATEYLKMLKHQVQVMSMGAGVCMVPTMLPPGMQAMYPSHYTHFPQMGVGSGFGVRMPPDGRFPILPMTPMQLPHFAMPASGSASFVRATGPSRQVYGQPSQVEPQVVDPDSQRSVFPVAGVSGVGSKDEQPSLSSVDCHSVNATKNPSSQ